MNVRDLIEHLETLPEDADVMLRVYGCGQLCLVDLEQDEVELEGSRVVIAADWN